MFHIGIVVIPGVTQLDFTGPLQVVGRLPDRALADSRQLLEPRYEAARRAYREAIATPGRL